MNVRTQEMSYRADWVALTLFFLLSAVLWGFEDGIARMFLYVPGLSLSEVPLFERTKTLLLQFLNVLVGTFCYLALFQYKLHAAHTRMVPVAVPDDGFLSREQLKVLYEDSPVPYFLIDTTGALHAPNKATLRFFGGTVEECERTNLFERLVTPDAAHDIAMLHTKVERSVPLSEEEMSVKTFRGEVRRVLVSIHTVASAVNMPFRHLVTFVDVTKERQNEEAKTDFLLLASHQLRTPTTTIRWYTDYLLHTPALKLNDIVRGYLEEIHRGNERMIDLVTTLLTVSRIEMGIVAPDIAPVRMDELVQDLLQELKPDYEKKKQHIEVTKIGDDRFMTDRAMMRIAIHNLLTNAIKYTPVDGSIHVYALYGADSGTVMVSDTGCGVPLAEQDKVFTKLFRATNARKIAASGTGLGLYLTRAFVEKLRGSITYESQENVGTKFTLTLPRVAPGA